MRRSAGWGPNPNRRKPKGPPGYDVQVLPSIRQVLQIGRAKRAKPRRARSGPNQPISDACQKWPSRRGLGAGLQGQEVIDKPSGKEQRRIYMKPSTTDQIKGNVHEVKGKVKEKAGQVTNNPKLEAEGQDEKFAGKVQKKVGQIEKVLEK
jgi:uncharacterized protein YjbJ (UPF0337 family)